MHQALLLFLSCLVTHPQLGGARRAFWDIFVRHDRLEKLDVLPKIIHTVKQEEQEKPVTSHLGNHNRGALKPSSISESEPEILINCNINGAPCPDGLICATIDAESRSAHNILEDDTFEGMCVSSARRGDACSLYDGVVCDRLSSCVDGLCVRSSKLKTPAHDVNHDLRTAVACNNMNPCANSDEQCVKASVTVPDMYVPVFQAEMGNCFRTVFDIGDSCSVDDGIVCNNCSIDPTVDCYHETRCDPKLGNTCQAYAEVGQLCRDVNVYLGPQVTPCDFWSSCGTVDAWSRLTASDYNSGGRCIGPLSDGQDCSKPKHEYAYCAEASSVCYNDTCASFGLAGDPCITSEIADALDALLPCPVGQPYACVSSDEYGWSTIYTDLKEVPSLNAYCLAPILLEGHVCGMSDRTFCDPTGDDPLFCDDRATGSLACTTYGEDLEYCYPDVSHIPAGQQSRCRGPDAECGVLDPNAVLDTSIDVYHPDAQCYVVADTGNACGVDDFGNIVGVCVAPSFCNENNVCIMTPLEPGDRCNLEWGETCESTQVSTVCAEIDDAGNGELTSGGLGYCVTLGKEMDECNQDPPEVMCISQLTCDPKIHNMSTPVCYQRGISAHQCHEEPPFCDGDLSCTEQFDDGSFSLIESGSGVCRKAADLGNECDGESSFCHRIGTYCSEENVCIVVETGHLMNFQTIAAASAIAGAALGVAVCLVHLDLSDALESLKEKVIGSFAGLADHQATMDVSEFLDRSTTDVKRRSVIFTAQSNVMDSPRLASMEDTNLIPTPRDP